MLDIPDLIRTLKSSNMGPVSTWMGNHLVKITLVQKTLGKVTPSKPDAVVIGEGAHLEERPPFNAIRKRRNAQRGVLLREHQA